ncbi:hypothetical protein Fmac_016141 [Flemingia macrophylla]|uniref:Uncharacterized protein n=1 Tax=Flemingia macrophylla TaxID=520843 RepID=A0ABD1MGL3_9FABA
MFGSIEHTQPFNATSIKQPTVSNVKSVKEAYSNCKTSEAPIISILRGMSVRIHREWVAYDRLWKGPLVPTNRCRKPSLKVITGISSLKVRTNHQWVPIMGAPCGPLTSENRYNLPCNLHLSARIPTS